MYVHKMTNMCIYVHNVPVCTMLTMYLYLLLGGLCWHMTIESTQKCTCLKCLNDVNASLVGWKWANTNTRDELDHGGTVSLCYKDS